MINQPPVPVPDNPASGGPKHTLEEIQKEEEALFAEVKSLKKDIEERARQWARGKEEMLHAKKAVALAKHRKHAAQARITALQQQARKLRGQLNKQRAHEQGRREARQREESLPAFMRAAEAVLTPVQYKAIWEKMNALQDEGQ